MHRHPAVRFASGLSGKLIIVWMVESWRRIIWSHAAAVNGSEWLASSRDPSFAFSLQGKCAGCVHPRSTAFARFGIKPLAGDECNKSHISSHHEGLLALLALLLFSLRRQPPPLPSRPTLVGHRTRTVYSQQHRHVRPLRTPPSLSSIIQHLAPPTSAERPNHA